MTKYQKTFFTMPRLSFVILDFGFYLNFDL